MNTAALLSFLTEGVLYIALLVATVYTVIFAYHWFQYGSKRATSTTALLLFIAGAVVCLGMMLAGYWFM